MAVNCADGDALRRPWLACRGGLSTGSSSAHVGSSSSLASLRGIAPALCLGSGHRRHASLIVACDDRSAKHLYELYYRQTARDTPIAQVIARSLGRLESCRIAQARSELISIARADGVRAPPMRLVKNTAGLRNALTEIGLPAVLKVDGSWGGMGVLAAHSDDQAELARRLLAHPLGAGRVLKRLLVDRDPYHLLPWLNRAIPKVSVQHFIHGRPANSLAACWNGEVLAAIHVEVLRTNQVFGSSSVVRVIEHPDMVYATERLVRRLGLSGFCGLDFMIEEATGDAHLIEINALPTPICHLALGAGRNPVSALVARLEGATPSAQDPMTGNPVIAFFPQAWSNGPNDAVLRTGYHDVPWEDPALVRELMRPAYSARGLLARLWRMTMPQP